MYLPLPEIDNVVLFSVDFIGVKDNIGVATKELTVESFI